MNAYQLHPRDQRQSSWLVFSESRQKRNIPVRERYADLLCKRCRRFDHDQVFARGFDGDCRIRGSTDIVETDDGFLCVRERVIALVSKKNWGGMQLKPIGPSGWYVANTTLRVDSVSGCFELHSARCPLCHRPAYVLGNIDQMSQISAPTMPGTFFSTKIDRSCYCFTDRSLFMTEDIAGELKQNGIKGGELHKLLTEEENRRMCILSFRGQRGVPASLRIDL